MGLDMVEIIVKTENVFDINFYDDELAKIKTVGEFYELILEKTNNKTKKLEDLEVWNNLIKIIAKILDINENEINKSSRFIDDLGAG